MGVSLILFFMIRAKKQVPKVSAAVALLGAAAAYMMLQYAFRILFPSIHRKGKREM